MGTRDGLGDRHLRGSITTDRITKPAQYAAAGIAHFWRLETDPVRLVTYRLADDVHAEAGSWGAGEVAQVTEPFPVAIDIEALRVIA